MKWIDKIVDAIRLDEEWNVDEKQRLTDEEIINVNDETGTAEYRIAAYYEQEGDENEYVVAYPVEEKLLLSKIALLKVCEAETDLENKEIDHTDYTDGSREYHYDGFDLIKLNTHLGNHDIYFVPSSMSYYDVVKV